MTYRIVLWNDKVFIVEITVNISLYCIIWLDVDGKCKVNVSVGEFFWLFTFQQDFQRWSSGRSIINVFLSLEFESDHWIGNKEAKNDKKKIGGKVQSLVIGKRKANQIWLGKS